MAKSPLCILSVAMVILPSCSAHSSPLASTAEQCSAFGPPKIGDLFSLNDELVLIQSMSVLHERMGKNIEIHNSDVKGQNKQNHDQEKERESSDAAGLSQIQNREGKEEDSGVKGQNKIHDQEKERESSDAAGLSQIQDREGKEEDSGVKGQKQNEEEEIEQISDEGGPTGDAPPEPPLLPLPRPIEDELPEPPLPPLPQSASKPAPKKTAMKKIAHPRLSHFLEAIWKKCVSVSRCSNSEIYNLYSDNGEEEVELPEVDDKVLLQFLKTYVATGDSVKETAQIGQEGQKSLPTLTAAQRLIESLPRLTPDRKDKLKEQFYHFFNKANDNFPKHRVYLHFTNYDSALSCAGMVAGEQFPVMTWVNSLKVAGPAAYGRLDTMVIYTDSASDIDRTSLLKWLRDQCSAGRADGVPAVMEEPFPGIGVADEPPVKLKRRLQEHKGDIISFGQAYTRLIRLAMDACPSECNQQKDVFVQTVLTVLRNHGIDPLQPWKLAQAD